MIGAIRLFSVAAVLSLAGVAEAGFQFTYTVTEGTGPLAGKNVFRFYTRNDQTGEQAGTTSLLAMEVTFESLGGPLGFDFRDIDGDGAADANVPGFGIHDANPTATYLRIGNPADMQTVLPRDHLSDTNGDKTPDRDPVPAYQNRSEVTLTGFNLNRIDATQGDGLLYGVAVVPLGSDVKVEGKVAAEKGGIIETGAPLTLSRAVAEYGWTGLPEGGVGAAPAEPGPDFRFSFVAVAPEPSGLLVMGLCAMALGRRRVR
jgi:hypothetical protein